MTRAAPPYFPYHHRTLAGRTDKLMLAQYEACQTAFNNGNKRWRAVKNSPFFDAAKDGEFQPNRYGKQGENDLEGKRLAKVRQHLSEPDHKHLSRGGENG